MNGHMFAPSWMFPYSSAAVPLDNAVASLSTFMICVDVAFSPEERPVTCVAGDPTNCKSVIVQTAIASPAE